MQFFLRTTDQNGVVNGAGDEPEEEGGVDVFCEETPSSNENEPKQEDGQNDDFGGDADDGCGKTGGFKGLQHGCPTEGGAVDEKKNGAADWEKGNLIQIIVIQKPNQVAETEGNGAGKRHAKGAFPLRSQDFLGIERRGQEKLERAGAMIVMQTPHDIGDQEELPRKMKDVEYEKITTVYRGAPGLR